MWSRSALTMGLALALGFGLAACAKTKLSETTAAVEVEKAGPAAKVAYRAKSSPTLAAVRRRGWLSCGVNPGLAGFAYPDQAGAWRGFDVDVCRAVAAAVLGDSHAVRFTPIPAESRFGILASGKIDLLSRNTSWTFARDVGLNVEFPVVTYYDGQGFLAPKALGLASAEELNGARICVQSGTASQANLAEYFKVRGLNYREVLVKTDAEARAKYQNDGCDAFAADVSALASSRSVMNNPGAHVILPDVISKEPLGPVVRQGDPTWTDIVRWSVYALIEAEELGVSSKTIDRMRDNSHDPRVRRLLGLEGGFGAMAGLQSDWAYNAIRQVGAYDEIFQRNVGDRSPLKLQRGQNALWNAGGLHYSPPIR